jgi:hypothetical protein
MIFIADLIACSTCFGHHYAHNQELESIIQLVAACGLWCLVFNLSVWCRAEGYVSGLRASALLALKSVFIICLSFKLQNVVDALLDGCPARGPLGSTFQVFVVELLV